VQFYVLRKLIESELRRKGYNHRNAYIPSLSSQTIVYKGQLMPSQVCLGQVSPGSNVVMLVVSCHFRLLA